MVVVCSAYWVFISLLDMLENKKKLSADILEARNERMTSMVHSQFYMNLFWSVIFAVVIFLILVGLDKFDLINIFN